MSAPFKIIIALAIGLLALGVCVPAPGQAISSDKEKDYAFIAPVLPGKVGDMNAFWRDVSTRNASALDNYMRTIGQTRLLEFRQKLPRGTFLVTYVRENTGLGPTFGENRLLGTPIAKYVRDQFADFIGYDFTAPKSAPRVEKLWEWTDTGHSGPAKRQAAFAIPVKPGMSDALKSFYAELSGPRKDEEARHLRYQTISKIEAFLQHRPEGDYLVQYMETDEPLNVVMARAVGAGMQIADYIKERLADLTDLDPSSPAPDIRQLYSWSAAGGLRATAPAGI